MSRSKLSLVSSPANTRRTLAGTHGSDVAFITSRAVLEAAIVAALANWGVAVGGGAAAQIALGIAAPLAGFGFWGAVDFHQAGRWAEPLRLLQELVISAAAAAAWYGAGQHVLAWSLAGLSATYHGMVYATGRRLLKPRPTITRVTLPESATHQRRAQAQPR